jgi:photosystem II stability/assembly factor-like uncharacterized protein
MKLNNRTAGLVFLALITVAGMSCNGSGNKNSQQARNGTPSKPGRWIAQYRSPASLNYSDADLAVFYYSAISVVSADVVFVCGDVPNPKGEERQAVVVRTTDGGRNWTEIPIRLPGVEIQALNAIHFISPDLGWAVGADSGNSGVVVKTTDGGSTWALTRIAEKEIPTAICFVDADHGWIGGATPPPGEEEGLGGPSAILATADGGHTWQAQYNIPVSIYRIFFLNPTTGWASGSKGIIYNTSDGGRTWDTQRTELEAGDGPIDLNGEGVKQFAIRGLQFIDKDHGFAAATATEEQTGRVIITSNGGDAWRRQWIVKGAGVRDVFFINPDEGWALTDQGQYVYHTIDGGKTWLSEPRVFEQDVAPSRLAGADPSHIWLVGGGAIFYRVTD